MVVERFGGEEPMLREDPSIGLGGELYMEGICILRTFWSRGVGNSKGRDVKSH